MTYRTEDYLDDIEHKDEKDELIVELREALKAIKARIEGEWDNEALDNMLLATTSQDCLHIADEALRKVDGAEFTSDVVEQQAETIANMQTTITELRNALMDLLTHVEPLWNDRVRDGELELTVSAEDVENAIEALRKVGV